MKKNSGVKTNRFFSLILLPAAFPLWVLGWFLFYIGGHKQIFSKNTQKNNPKVEKNIKN